VQLIPQYAKGETPGSDFVPGTVIIKPPLYLGDNVACWKCVTDVRVAALLGKVGNEVCLLSDVIELPSVRGVNRRRGKCLLIQLIDTLDAPRCFIPACPLSG
jgi:hypothetical protein